MVKCLFQLDEPNHYMKNGCFTISIHLKLLVSAFRCRCLAWISSQVREDDLGSTRRDYNGGSTQSHGGLVFSLPETNSILAPENRQTPKRKGSSSFPIHFQVRIWLVSGRVHDFCLSIGWLWLVFQPWIFGGYHSLSLRSETLLLAILRGEGDRQVNLAVGKSPPTNNCVIDPSVTATHKSSNHT